MRIALTLWAGLLCLLGCGAEERVFVGAMDRSIDLTRCSGDGTVCEPNYSATFWQPDQSELNDVPTCIPVVDPNPWRVAWMRRVSGFDCGQFGECEAHVRAFAPDGSVWITALKLTAGRPSGERMVGIFLGHYAPNGDVLVERIVDSWGVRAPDYALDDAEIALAGSVNGHAVVAVSWLRDERDAEGWIATYDARGERITQRVELHGLMGGARLAVAIDADESVLLSAGNTTTSWSSRADAGPSRGHGALAKLSSSLRVDWLQSLPIPEGMDVMIAERGAALITASSISLIGAQWGIAWYSERGNLQKALKLARGRIVQQRSGESVLIDDSDLPSTDVTFREISATGKERWAARIRNEPPATGSSSGRGCGAVGLSPDGSIYRFRNVDGQNRILHLHASHTTCSFASIENLAAGADVFCIATDDRGELYIEASNQDGTQFLGKLER